MDTITTQIITDHYSALARESPFQNKAHIQKVAQSFGYSPEDLSSIPEGSNLGVSCGNPLAIASLKEGETVLDLGSGAGFDVFQAAKRVGENGMAIGVDMSQDMLSRAEKNAEKANVKNVKFILAPITKIPLEDESVDCVISNCVVNLLERSEKLVCFREVYRVLRKGGRVAVSDILAKKVLTEELRRDMGLWVGCISGACLVSEYEEWLREAGFEDIMIVDKHSDLNIYKEREHDEAASCYKASGAKPQEQSSSCCAPSTLCCSSKTEDAQPNSKQNLTSRVADIDFNEWVSSYSIYAVKPDIV